MSALSSAARYEYYVELGNGLPPPVVPSDKNRELRINTAIEAFEVLRPGDAFEALLAVQIVLSGAHAIEIMREAGFCRDDFSKLSRCRAQAAAMMRAGASVKRTLEREQKMRWAVEAVARAAPAEPAAAVAAPASADSPVAPPAPAEVVAAPPVQSAAHAVQAPLPQAAQATTAAPTQPPPATQLRPVTPPAALPLVKAGSVPPPSPEAIDKAETFAADNMEVAVRIRRDRGVTSKTKAFFRNVTMPTDPAVMDALVRGTSTLLTLLDGPDGEELDAAD